VTPASPCLPPDVPGGETAALDRRALARLDGQRRRGVTRRLPPGVATVPSGGHGLVPLPPPRSDAIIPSLFQSPTAMTIGAAKLNRVRLVGESSCDLSVWSCSASGQAIPRGPFSPMSYVLRRASPRESGGPGGLPYEGVARSAPYAEDGSRRRDPPSPLRTPPGCDAPRKHALLGRFGRLESCPCLQQLSPRAPSLASSPPARPVSCGSRARRRDPSSAYGADRATPS
jgi:hypothetical protein